jgi:hypothetical protein
MICLDDNALKLISNEVSQCGSQSHLMLTALDVCNIDTLM